MTENGYDPTKWESYCPECEKWFSNNEWGTGDVYVSEGDGYSFCVDGEKCPECDEIFWSVEEREKET